VQRLLGLFVVVFVLAGAQDAAAQDAVALPAWDSSVVTGLFIGMPREVSERETYDETYQVAMIAITAGRYFTPHVKLEGELTFSLEGERYVQRVVQVPGVGPYPVSAEHKVRTNSVSGAVVWQFLENQWAHPFVFAGGSVDFDRERLHTYPQSYYRGDPRIPGNEVVVATDHIEDLGTTERLRGLLGVGTKLYVAPRAFLRLETRVGFSGNTGGHVAFRIGAGLDF
jgi:hypothetical protein